MNLMSHFTKEMKVIILKMKDLKLRKSMKFKLYMIIYKKKD